MYNDGQEMRYTDSSDTKKEFTKVEKLIETIKNSVSLMLSYGEASDVIPVGVFEVSRLIDSSVRPYKEGIGTPETTLIEFKRVREDNLDFDSPCEKIYIPLEDFIKVYPSSISEENHSMLHCNYDVEPYLETLLALENVISERIKKLALNKENGEAVTVKDISDNSIFNAEYKTLDDINATYVNERGEIMGNNYSVMPYSLGKILRKTLVKRMVFSEDEKEMGFGRGR